MPSISILLIASVDFSCWSNVRGARCRCVHFIYSRTCMVGYCSFSAILGYSWKAPLSHTGVQSNCKSLIARSRHHRDNYKQTTPGRLTRMSACEFDWSGAYSPAVSIWADFLSSPLAGEWRKRGVCSKTYRGRCGMCRPRPPSIYKQLAAYFKAIVSVLWVTCEFHICTVARTGQTFFCTSSI